MPDHLDLLRESSRLSQDLLDRTDLNSTTMARPTPCHEYDVDALIEHILGTHQFLLTTAGGAPVEDDGPIAQRHRRLAEASVATWTQRGSDGTVDLAGNEVPAGFALSLHACEAFVHGWDLATAVGEAYEPSPDLVETAWEAARLVVSDDNRSTEHGAPYGPAVAVDDQATPLEQLIAFTGRKHSMTPSPARH